MVNPDVQKPRLGIRVGCVPLLPHCIVEAQATSGARARPGSYFALPVPATYLIWRFCLAMRVTLLVVYRGLFFVRAKRQVFSNELDTESCSGTYVQPVANGLRNSQLSLGADCYFVGHPSSISYFRSGFGKSPFPAPECYFKCDLC